MRLPSKPTSNWQRRRSTGAIEGFLRQLQVAGFTYVVRAPVNFTARQAALSRVYREGRKPMREHWSAPSRGPTGSYYYCDATRPPRDPQLGTGPTSLWLYADFLGRFDMLQCATGRADI